MKTAGGEPPRAGTRRLVRTWRPSEGVVIGAASLANTALGFVQQWVVLTRVGPGRATDALVAGMIVPQIVLTVVTGSLVHVLVPVLSIEDDATRRQTVWTAVQGAVLLFGLLAAVLAATAPAWVPLTVPGFDAAAAALAVRLVRIQVLGVVFTAVSALLWSLYRSRRRFIWAEASGLLATAVALAIVLVAVDRHGVAAAAWAAVARAALAALLLAPGLGGYLRPRFGTAAVREIWRRAGPLLGGAAYFKTDVFVDRFLASMAPAGSLSLLSAAQTLYAAGGQVLNRAVVVPIIPRLATAAHRGDWSTFGRLSRERAALMIGLTGTGYLILALAGRPLLGLVLGHGRFGADDITQLWSFLLLLVGVWIAGSAGQVIASSFYAYGDTRTPTRIGIIGFTVGTAAKVALFLRFGAWGIAAGATLLYLFNATWLRLALARRIEHERAAAAPAAALANL